MAVNPRRSSPLEGTVEKLVPGGAGLVRTSQHGAALVPHVLPGERVRFEMAKPPHARLLEVLEASPDRIDSDCSLAGRCGGCDLRHTTADRQRELRLGLVGESLGQLATDLPLRWVPATPPRGRTRARWHARGLGDGRVVLGYHALGSDHVVEAAACPALDPRLEAAFEDARAILAGARGQGDVHAALGAGGLPVLGLAWHPSLPGSAFAEAERRVHQGRLAGVAVGVEGVAEPMKIGDPRPVTKSLDGQDLLSPSFGFAQASEVGNAVLVERVVAAAACREEDDLLELFAGSGNLSVALAPRVAKMTAVEQSRPAVLCLRQNLETRGLLSRVRVVEGDAQTFVPKTEPRIVVLDPPRAGARQAVERIAALPPRKRPRLVYVSCDPPSLARDLRILIGAGARIASLEAIDLFPDTSHMELVAAVHWKP